MGKLAVSLRLLHSHLKLFLEVQANGTNYKLTIEGITSRNLTFLSSCKAAKGTLAKYPWPGAKKKVSQSSKSGSMNCTRSEWSVLRPRFLVAPVSSPSTNALMLFLIEFKSSPTNLASSFGSCIISTSIPSFSFFFLLFTFVLFLGLVCNN